MHESNFAMPCWRAARAAAIRMISSRAMPSSADANAIPSDTNPAILSFKRADSPHPPVANATQVPCIHNSSEIHSPAPLHNAQTRCVGFNRSFEKEHETIANRLHLTRTGFAAVGDANQFGRNPRVRYVLVV